VVRNEVHVHYQPLVRFETSEVIGLEALLRWQHPVRGMLAPDEFLSVAEETGLIVPIGAWVLREACAQAAAWAGESLGHEPLSVSVNLSGRQLADDDLVSSVSAALLDSGLEPSLLVLEITEATLAGGDRDHAIEVLHRLTE